MKNNDKAIIAGAGALQTPLCSGNVHELLFSSFQKIVYNYEHNQIRNNV